MTVLENTKGMPHEDNSSDNSAFGELAEAARIGSISGIAWGDESVRLNHDPRMYLMCATMFAEESGSAVAAFAKVKPSGMRKLHWYDMDGREKRRALEALARVPHWNIVAIASPVLEGVRIERARRKCLERLLPNLEETGCDRFVLESRWKQEDKADLDMVMALRNRKNISSIKVEHMSPDAGEPRLWVPDQILGAVGDILCGSSGLDKWSSAWEGVRDRISVLTTAV